MIRLTLAIAATLIATPALAGTYSAKPAVAPPANRIVGHDIVWACGLDTCRGTTEASRPVVLCQGLARRAGRIDSFVADGRSLDAAALAKCNTAAKQTTGSALAKAN